MNERIRFMVRLAAMILLAGSQASAGTGQAMRFADDRAFLKEHVDLVELRDGASSVLVAPAYQGRVMTSTFDVENGPSFGWINRPVVEQGFLAPEEEKGKLQEHIYVFGGEERFWMGPEGGQFSIFFEPQAAFEFATWFTPPCIDTEAFSVVSRTDKEIVFKHSARLQNWSGTRFQAGIRRTVRLLGKAAVEQRLGMALEGDLEMVAYETENTIINEGDFAWTKETGMLSIWILGMYPPSDGTTLIIPFMAGDTGELGPKVNDTYFGKVPEDYLKIGEDVLFFKGDGTRRAKIGISPKRAKGIAGSYDEDTGILNLVTYSAPDAKSGYVNSMWELQKEPFSGDLINAYNDGPPTPGADPLGPFYELETSSPAAGLKPGEGLTHTQTTIHLRGDRDTVDRIARQLLGVRLSRIEEAF